MRIANLTRTLLILLLGTALWALDSAPGVAGTLSVGDTANSGILVSPAGSGSAKSSQNVLTSLVDIKALDRAVPQKHDGMISMGAPQRSGQGIIIDSSGIIATNKHIIGEAPQHVYVRLAGGETFEAKVVHISRTDDLALVKIAAPLPLRAMALGDSSQLRIGNRVLAFANPTLNKERQRTGEIIQVYTEVSTNTVAIMEVNIQLKPGDSGGPIVNEQGLLLGLIMANQISDRSRSYAIASNKIQQEYFRYRNSILN